MRILLEILLIGVLAFVGWRQPFRDAVATRFPKTEIAPSRLAMKAMESAYNARPDSSGRGYNPPSKVSSGEWMYNEPGALDAKPKRP